MQPTIDRIDLGENLELHDYKICMSFLTVTEVHVNIYGLHQIIPEWQNAGKVRSRTWVVCTEKPPADIPKYTVLLSYSKYPVWYTSMTSKALEGR